MPANLSTLKVGIGEMLAGMRSVLEPLLIFHQFGPYACIEGQAFRRRILYWRDPSIDAILWAFDSLAELGEKERLQEIIQTRRRELLTFLVENFVSTDGHDGHRGFRQCDGAPPTVYASGMAINVLRHIHNQPYYAAPLEPLGYERAIETQREVEELVSRKTDFVDKTIDFTRQSWDPETGGFFDSPRNEFPQRADISTTHSAYLLLWNLERSDSVKQEVRSFLLERCLKENTGTGAIGFANHPKEIAETSPTYYALRILVSLGEREWIEKHKPGIVTFLKARWQEKTGGFGAAPSFSPTLVSTSHALEIFWDILHDPEFLLDPARIVKIQAYVDRCRSLRYGGFRFQSSGIRIPLWREVGWFSPDLYTTRHMIGLAMQPMKNNPGPTAGVIALDHERVMQFTTRTWREDQWPAALGVKERGIVKLIRKAADFLLEPSNVLRCPPSIIRPIPFYLTSMVVIVILFTLWITGLLNTNVTVVKALVAPLLALEATAIMGIVWWIVTR